MQRLKAGSVLPAPPQVAIKFLERGAGVSRGVVREVLNHRLCVAHPNIAQFKEVRAMLPGAAASPPPPPVAPACMGGPAETPIDGRAERASPLAFPPRRSS